jgi:hypothetical protein
MFRHSWIKQCLLIALIASVSVFIYALYQYGMTHGLKTVQWRVLERESNKAGCGVRMSLTLNCKKQGFVTVIMVENSTASVVRPCDTDHPIYSGIDYPIQLCVNPASARLFLVVTQATLPGTVVDSINAELKLLHSHGPIGDELLATMIYSALQRHGHQWVALAQVQ